MSLYNIVAASNESTVVAEYTPEATRSDAYQSEAELEQEFIRLLTAQGYEYLTIHEETALTANLRAQLELLNGYQFTDGEWERFFNEIIANANDGIVEKTRRIQTDHIQNLRRDDGSTKNITLIDKKNTKYYSNTTRSSHVKEMNEAGRRKSKKTSNSFEFTSFWADGNNKVIADLIDFTKTFLAKHTILNVLVRYCVFTSEDIPAGQGTYWRTSGKGLHPALWQHFVSTKYSVLV